MACPGLFVPVRVGCSAVSSFPEVRIAAERLELREFSPQDAAAVNALGEAGDYTALPPGAPSQPSEVYAWLSYGVHSPATCRRRGSRRRLVSGARAPFGGRRWKTTGCTT